MHTQRHRDKQNFKKSRIHRGYPFRCSSGSFYGICRSSSIGIVQEDSLVYERISSERLERRGEDESDPHTVHSVLNLAYNKMVPAESRSLRSEEAELLIKLLELKAD